jgi:hypothetical protein
LIGDALPAPRPAADHGPQWLALLLAVIVGSGWWWRSREDRFVHPPAPLAEGDARWFLTVRMPEVGPRESDAEWARDRVDEWLQALRKEGFTPARLSEADGRLRAGRGLPEKSVTILFDPGTRRTFEVLGPLLEARGWTGTWLTDGAALERKDRRYVSVRGVRDMVRSGWWDVGLTGADPTRLTLLSKESAPRILSVPGGPLWSLRDGKYAVNSGEPRLHRLAANVSWSGQELADRLMSEVPLTGPARLGLRRIQDMRWGVVEAKSDPSDAGFELAAPADRRGDAVYWLGTRGVSDLRVDLRVEDLMGELWLLLRSDDKRGESVRVAFADRGVMLEEERDGQRSVVGAAPAPSLRQPAVFTATVRLSGDRIDVSIDGKPCVSARGLSPQGSPEGLVRLMIYEKVTGAARAGAIRLSARPLTGAAEER